MTRHDILDHTTTWPDAFAPAPWRDDVLDPEFDTTLGDLEREFAERRMFLPGRDE